MSEPDDIASVARNRKALHDYEILERFEAGVELRGSEVKSVRDGRISFADAYASVERGELILRNLNISHYPQSSGEPLDPARPRKLLMHKREIEKLREKTEQKGYALIPLSLYFKGSRLKIELGLGRGKKQYDKRESIAERDAQRRIDRAMRRER